MTALEDLAEMTALEDLAERIIEQLKENYEYYYKDVDKESYITEMTTYLFNNFIDEE